MHVHALASVTLQLLMEINALPLNEGIAGHRLNF